MSKIHSQYVCNDCGREISSSEYESQSDIFCSQCGGHIEEVFAEPDPQDNRATESQRSQNLQMVARHLTPKNHNQAATNEEEQQPEKSKLSQIMAKWGPIGAVLLFVLGKSKYLIMIAKVAKFHTLITMVLAVWVYAQFWGFKFAVGFVLLIFIHECGHALTMKRLGIPAGAPVFIPFVGAVISMKSMPKDAYIEALVGLGGPALGTIGAFLCLFVGVISGSEFWYALAYTGFMINLFNMIPISPLDGGRITGVLSRWIWIVGFALGGYLYYRIGSPILLLVLVLGVFSFISSFRQQDASYYQVSLERRVLIGAGYFLSLFVMAIGMWIAYHPLQNIG
jgi:Zn-dependent protease/DNA-directed RNA polymerase subunit RPC12/RpoP